MSQEPKSKTQAVESAERQVKSSQSGCCGGAAPQGVDACCALDAEVKSTGGSGCGCVPALATGERKQKGCG